MSADCVAGTNQARRATVRGLTVALLLSPMACHVAGIGIAHAEDPRVELLEAVRLDDAVTVKRLLAAAVSPNLREKTHGPAIVMAAKLDSFASLAELARAPEVELDATDSSGQTALMLAAIKGHAPSVSLLLERGARVDSRQGWTALHYAAAGGHTEVARILILHGANLDARSDNGTTPAMLAARQKQFSTLELLADTGADLAAVNERGMNVIRYLEAHGEKERAADIRERIARRRR